MKRFTICMLALMLVITTLTVGLTNLSYSQEYTKAEDFFRQQEFSVENRIDQDFSISVIGETTKSVQPDMATIVASIETLDLNIQQSKNSNFQIFNEILSQLEAAGISKENIVFDSFTSYPSYDYNNNKTLIGYHSITTFTIETNELSSISDIIGVITQNGVTSIRNINYKISNLDEIYSEVLSMALENAKQKAEKITGKDDLSICCINEEAVYSSTSMYKAYSESLQDNSLIGKMDIKAKVSVKFE